MPPPSKKPLDTIPYYPHPRYLERNQAPEQYPKAAITALARAHKRAVEGGHIRPEVGDLMLANVLIEGSERAHTYAVNSEGPANDRRLEKTPISQDMNADFNKRLQARQADAALVREADDKESASITAQNLPATAKYNAGQKRLAKYYAAVDDHNKRHPWTEEDEQQMRANDAFITLFDKQRQFGENVDPLNIIQRWNGWGPPGSKAEKMTLNHRQKVITQQTMLAHPANKAILDFYRQELAGGVKAEEEDSGGI